ncbi:MAG: carboxypeptidase regulatory-like domain-containing protein, partial [Clostridia bacterium]|nr:carboxypeptidase regulatory-like domain-containing protein [Clostridia bacterium]
MLRTILSVSLVVCMLMSMSVTAWAGIFAADTDDDGKVKYVSIGDSVTNGFGMTGYKYDDGTNVYGYRRETPTAYPAMIKEKLEDTFGEGNVELDQLAISNFRMEELHYMLDDDYEGDAYMVRVFGGEKDPTSGWYYNVIKRWFAKDAEAKAKYADSGLQNYEILREEFRESIREADVISIDLGSNNFGTFLTSKIRYLLGLTDTNDEMDFTQFMDADTYATVKALLDGMVKELVGDGEAFALAETLATTLMYGYLGFAQNLDASLEIIYEMNPDVEVIIVDVYNMMEGTIMTSDTFGGLDLAALYGTFVDLANLYSRELSPYASRLTHVTLGGAPELFFDYYKDYDVTGELHPSAERLLDEFVQELLDQDDDEFAVTMDNINTLDSYVNNIQAVVKQNVIGKIVDGVQTAVDGVNDAMEGVETVYTAVNAVETAQGVVTDVIVDQVVPNLNIPESMLVSVIEGKVTDDHLTMLGYEATDENRAYVAQKIYDIAVIYDDTNSAEGEAAANKAAIIALLAIVKVDGEAMGEETATAAYNAAEAYNSVKANGGTEEEAVIAGMQTQVDAETAQTAWQLYSLYQNYIDGGATEEEALAATAKMAIVSQGYDAGTAEAMYDIYVCEQAGTIAAEDDVLNVLVTVLGITEAQAKSVYACYAGGLDGQYDNDDVRTTMVLLMVQGGIFDNADEAAENYDLYVVYKNLPHTFCIVSNYDTIYVDALINNIGSIDMDEIAQKFIAGEMKLELSEEEQDDPEAVAQYRNDSSLILMYIRFLANSGVFIHPNEGGQENMTAGIWGELLELDDTPYIADETLDITIDENTVLVSIGDSMANDNKVSDGESAYGALTAALTGIADGIYHNEALDGMRTNDLLAILDPSYAGDAYTEAKFASASIEHFGEADVILMNVGAANLGFTVEELMRYTTDGSTYPMTFSGIGAVGEELGGDLDAMIAMVNEKLTSGEVDASVTQLMLVFESYGYGYTLFADSFAAAVDAVREANPDAVIVLYSLYDLLGDAYFATDSAYLEIGGFFAQGAEMINGRIRDYAAQHENCVYIDITDTESKLDVIQANGALNLAGTTDGNSNIAVAAANVYPTADGHQSIAHKTACALNVHTFTDGICDTCGAEQHEHPLTYVEAAEANCHEVGNTAHWYCETCDETFADKDGIKAAGNVEIAIDPDNHDGETEVRGAVEATEESEGYTGDTYCLGCETVIEEGKRIPRIGETHTVTGNVTSWTTAENADNTVTLTFTDEAGEATVITLADGETAYTAELEAGTYTLTVKKANHVTRAYTVVVEDKDITQDVTVNPV